ncbi:Sulfotransferase [Melia azedarach]|uniref:Sulfotransferase n=1 Tax=Melia azedarach TaxID=155640 RepID=A0ACC1Y964_MELAZ|nr:Sulfotransferase [Melia azedarach]
MATKSADSCLNPEALDQLPKQTFWENTELHKWEGFWYNATVIKGMLGFQSKYEARSDDVILASSMKTGSTWLKAVTANIMLSGCDHDSDDDMPHARIFTLESRLGTGNIHPDDLLAMPSPRIFHTHLPFTSLPDSIKNSDCKIVYITRNPMDTLVSSWHFFNKVMQKPVPYPFEKAFDAFCNGIHFYGPYFDHVLQYWSESLKMPKKILFLKYEDLKRDPNGEVKKLASFLGRPFVNEDEVDKVVWKSSLERLKNLEVNKNGKLAHLAVTNSAYFRLGVVGDWKNYFTPEMKQRLDEITRIKLQGSGLHFEA